MDPDPDGLSTPLQDDDLDARVQEQALLRRRARAAGRPILGLPPGVESGSGAGDRRQRPDRQWWMDDLRDQPDDRRFGHEPRLARVGTIQEADLDRIPSSRLAG